MKQYFILFACIAGTLQNCLSENAAVIPGSSTNAMHEMAELISPRSKQSVGIVESNIVSFAAQYGMEVLQPLKTFDYRAYRILISLDPNDSYIARSIIKYGEDAIILAEDKESRGLLKCDSRVVIAAARKHFDVAIPFLMQYGELGANCLNGMSAENAYKLIQAINSGAYSSNQITTLLLSAEKNVEGIASQLNEHSTELEANDRPGKFASISTSNISSETSPPDASKSLQNNDNSRMLKYIVLACVFTIVAIAKLKSNKRRKQ